MATHSSPLAWEIPWTEKPDGLQSMRTQRVGRDLATKQYHCHPCSYPALSFSLKHTHTFLKRIFVKPLYSSNQHAWFISASSLPNLGKGQLSSFSAFSWSVTIKVQMYLLSQALNSGLSMILFILTDLALFHLVVSTKSLISSVSLGKQESAQANQSQSGRKQETRGKATVAILMF